MKKIIELFEKYKEIILYLFWGGLTTVVSWGSYALFERLLSPVSVSFNAFGNELSSSVIAANVLSWICATLFAFVTNKLWVFNSKSWSIKVFMPELIKFVSTRLATGAFEFVAVPLCVAIGLNQTIFGVEGMLAKIIVSIIVVLLNYIFSKLFIFKKKQ